MSYQPVSGIVPQYSTDDNELANGYYLKFYEANTTTPLSMATDSSGATLLVKCKLSSAGFPISNPLDNSTVFIPHVNANYRLVIYPTEADANANNTASALVNIPDVEPMTGNTVTTSTGTQTIATALDDRVIVANSVADIEAMSLAVVGDVISLNAGGRSGTFDVVAGDFSTELVADTLNGVYVGLADNLSATEKVAKRRVGLAVDVKWFGAVGDNITDDTLAIQAGITYTCGIQGTLHFGKSTYIYDSDEVFEIPSAIRLKGQGRGSAKVKCRGTGGSNRVGVRNHLFYVSSLTLDVIIEGMTWEQLLGETNDLCCFYVNYDAETFGSRISTNNASFIFWQNTGIHVIRGFQCSFRNTDFIGTSEYDSDSGNAAFTLDNAGIRLWGADGTDAVQQHSFSDLIMFDNVKIRKVKYGIDGYGIASAMLMNSPIEKVWCGIKNIKISNSLTPLSSTDRAGGGKAYINVDPSNWFEQISTYAAINMEIDETTGAEVDSGALASDYYYTGNIPREGSPVEDFIGIAANNPELNLSRVSSTLYVGDQNGGITPDYNFWFVFQTNPAVTHVLINKDRARFSMPGRFDGDLELRNSEGVLNATLDEATGNGIKLTSENEIDLFAAGPGAGLSLRGNAVVNPMVGDTHSFGSSTLRWKEIFASLQVFADDSAASSLDSGQFYRTSTGELRVKL